MAVEVRIVLIVVEFKANGASASACFVYIVSMHIVLLGISRPRADVADMPGYSLPSGRPTGNWG